MGPSLHFLGSCQINFTYAYFQNVNFGSSEHSPLKYKAIFWLWNLFSYHKILKLEGKLKGGSLSSLPPPSRIKVHVRHSWQIDTSLTWLFRPLVMKGFSKNLSQYLFNLMSGHHVLLKSNRNLS